MNIRFKGFIVNFLGFRESEPMLNFAFLWVIASVFMGILDTVRMLPEVTGQITLARGGKVTRKLAVGDNLADVDSAFDWVGAELYRGVERCE